MRSWIEINFPSKPHSSSRDLEHQLAVNRSFRELLEHSETGSDAWSTTPRSEFVGSLKGKPGLRRYLRRTPSGLLRIDRAAAKREAHLDGKWLLRASDLTRTPDDLAAAYKQLIAVGARVAGEPLVGGFEGSELLEKFLGGPAPGLRYTCWMMRLRSVPCPPSRSSNMPWRFCSSRTHRLSKSAVKRSAL